MEGSAEGGSEATPEARTEVTTAVKAETMDRADLVGARVVTVVRTASAAGPRATG